MSVAFESSFFAFVLRLEAQHCRAEPTFVARSHNTAVRNIEKCDLPRWFCHGDA